MHSTQGYFFFFMVGIYLNRMQIPAFKDGIDILTFVNIILMASIPVAYTISSRRMEAIDAVAYLH